MLYQLKGRFQQVADRFATRGMTANQASAGGVACVALTVLLFGLGWRWPIFLWLNPVVIFFRFILNALDGLLARRQNTASPAGEVMNELSDVIGDTLSFGVLYFLFPAHRLPLVALLLAIWFCEFVAVLGKSLPGGARRQESLGGGKPERAVFLGLLSLIWAYRPGWVPSFLGPYLMLVLLLVVLTGLRRIHSSLSAAEGQSYTSVTQYGN